MFKAKILFYKGCAYDEFKLILEAYDLTTSELA